MTGAMSVLSLGLLTVAGCQGAGRGSDGASGDGKNPTTDTHIDDDSDSGMPTHSAEDTAGGMEDETGVASQGGFAVEKNVSDALVRIISDEAPASLGQTLAIDDIDGDGQDDMVSAVVRYNGNAGGAFAIPGPLSVSGTAQELGLALTTTVAWSGAGRSLSLGDVDGDGYVDIGLGSPYIGGSNGLYVAFGPRADALSLDDSSVAALLGPIGTFAGHGSDLRGDLNDDGVADAVVGAYRSSSLQGLTFVAYGPVSGDLDLEAEADATLEGESGAIYAGRIIRSGGDMNGDGVDDLIVVCLGDLGLSVSGGFYVVYGPVAGDMALDDADGRYAGETANGQAGTWIDVGDVSGDGLSDIATTALDDTLAPSGGSAYVVLGPANADTWLTDAEVIVRGDVEGQYGGGVAMGDLDADGVAELLLGGFGNPTMGENAGAAFLFLDPAPGTYVFSDGEIVFTAEGPGDFLGMGVAIGDVHGDIAAEIVIGAPGLNDGGELGGGFYVMPGL